ncbi:MAG: BMC domain-containing protein [Myxococcota bacterium]
MKAPPPMLARRAALGAIELSSIARGIVVLDQMQKRAETEVVTNRTLSPGRYLIAISGSVAEVEESMAIALFTAAEDKVDHVTLPDPARDLLRALNTELEHVLQESLLIVETSTVSALLLGADRAVKEAEVQLLELRLGAGLTGKGVFTLTGPLHMVEASKAAIQGAVGPDRLVRIELIAQPHPDLPERLLEAERVWVRGTKKKKKKV